MDFPEKKKKEREKIFTEGKERVKEERKQKKQKKEKVEEQEIKLEKDVYLKEEGTQVKKEKLEDSGTSSNSQSPEKYSESLSPKK